MSTPSFTLPLPDAEALGNGSVWGEMDKLRQLEAIIAQAAAKAKATGQPVDLTVRVDPK